MSSLWRCPTCLLEGDAPLWTHIKTQAGERLGCIRCAGRLKLVPLGAADAEAQAWLEAFHTAKALEDAERQRNLLQEAEERFNLAFRESLDWYLDGSPPQGLAPDVSRPDGNSEDLQRT